LRYLPPRVKADFSPERAKLPDLASLETLETSGLRMNITTPAIQPRLRIDYDVPFYRRNPHERRFEISFAAAEACAHRLMT